MFKRYSNRQSSSTTPARKPVPKIRLQALESRVLLDAAAAATVEAMADQGHAPVDAQPDASNAELMQALAHANTHLAPVDSGDAHPADSADTAAHAANVYFIDHSLADVDTLVKDLGPNAEIHFIEPGQDGVQLIADTLAGRSDIGAIHLVSHGGEGQLHLGSATLTLESMQGEYRDELAAIGRSLSADGDILIYGCDFAEGTEGQHASELLASITGADVAASTDATGAAGLGGNWTLESHTGAVEARAIEARDWNHLMAAPTLTLDANGSSGGTGGNYRITSGPGGSEPTHLADVDALVSDADNDIQSLTLSLGGFANGAKESITFGSGNAMQFVRMDGVAHDPMKVTVGGTQFDIQYNGSAITVSRSGGGNISAAELNSLLRTVGYLNDATTASVVTGNRTVGFTVSDGASTSAARFTTVNVVAQQRFDDQGNAYVVIANTAPVVGSDGNTYAANRSSQLVTIAFGDAELQRSEWSAGINVNAMGFNTADGFSYGISGSNVVRIGGDGSMVILGTVDGTGAPASFAAGGFTSGDFGPDGLLYVYSSSYRTLQAINVQTMKWDHSVDFTVPTAGANIADIAYNAKDDKFYGVLPAASGGGLLSIDRTTGATRVIGATGVGPTVAFGGMFSDVTGNIYGFANSTGQVYKFDVNTGAGTALPNSSVGIVTGADGFSSRELRLVNTDPVAHDDGVYPVTVDGDGGYSFDPVVDYHGPVPGITYTVDDGNGGTATGKLTIVVTPVNDAPVAVDDTFSTKEDTALVLDLVGNDKDVDGDTLRVASINGTDLTSGTAQVIDVPNGKVNVAADGTITFAPNQDYKGPVSFDYEVTDPSGARDTGSVSITVTPVNDAPVKSGDTLGELTLSVKSVNDAPVTGDDTVTTDEDKPVVLDLLANDRDADGDALKITSINGTAVTGGAQTIDVPNGKVSIAADGTMTFTPNRDYNGPVSFAYVVEDTSGAKGTGTVNVSVASVNDAPVIKGPAQPGNPGAGKPGTPDQGKPGESGNGTDIVTEDTPLVVQPAEGLLSNVVDPDGDTLAIKDFTVDGVKGPILAGRPADIPGVGVLVINADGGYTFTPAPDYNGPVPMAHYTVADGHGGEVTGELALTVKAVNDEPVANDDAATTDEDKPVVLDLLGNDNDLDGDALRISSINGTALTGGVQDIAVPHGMVHIAADGTISFMPAPDYNGPVRIAYVVADSSGGTGTGTVRIDVAAVNDAPAVIGETVPGTNDRPIVVGPEGGLLTNDGDLDGDSLTIKSFTVSGVEGPIDAGKPVEIPGVGSLNINADGSYSFTPDRHYSGTLVISYTVSDGKGGLVTAALTLDIRQANDTYHDDYPFVFEPSDDLFGRHESERRPVVDAVGPRTGTPLVHAEGAVLDAINGLQGLGGTQDLSARGAVLQAVNGVASLHGSSLDSAHRVLGAEQGSQVVGHVASDNALHAQVEAMAGVDVETRSMTSLRVDSDVHLALYSRGQQTWIDVSDQAAPAQSTITKISATLADGKALPSWIRVDGHGHIAIERPVGADLQTLQITVTRKNGDTRTHVIEIDSNAGEMRQIGKSTEQKATGKDKAAKDNKTAASLFSAQLASASHQATRTVDADLLAALG
ncbi:cadherin-like domain-containing protein [Variovorax rhizosphaerae]|uniref:Ig-like domain-containing protein n=1 Tax=Variovorax rhizosphaerae TaxID=1836200 RepID=A0ABU8WQE9_9BURK